MRACGFTGEDEQMRLVSGLRAAIGVVRFEDPANAAALWADATARLELWRAHLPDPTLTIDTRWLPTIRTGVVVVDDSPVRLRSARRVGSAARSRGRSRDR
jgi:hypothetical protein